MCVFMIYFLYMHTNIEDESHEGLTDIGQAYFSFLKSDSVQKTLDAARRQQNEEYAKLLESVSGRTDIVDRKPSTLLGRLKEITRRKV